MKQSLEEKLRCAVENHRLNFEKYFGNGCKWYHHYLVVDELILARNLWDGYEINVYDNEYRNEHIATFIVDYVLNPKDGYYLVPRLQTYYLKDAV
jgi:hypothetical protein